MLLTDVDGVRDADGRRLDALTAGEAETLIASGGGSQAWSASGLPAGLSVSGNTITGTPTTAGNYTVTLNVNNGTTTKSARRSPVIKLYDPA